MVAGEPQTYFRSLLLSLRRERSDDRKYVCGSQARVPFMVAPLTFLATIPSTAAVTMERESTRHKVICFI